jgi:hypothetical protein
VNNSNCGSKRSAGRVTDAHNNTLNNTPTEGYTFRDKKGNVMKYGETTNGKKRYSEKYLKMKVLNSIRKLQGPKKKCICGSIIK